MTGSPHSVLRCRLPSGMELPEERELAAVVRVISWYSLSAGYWSRAIGRRLALQLKIWLHFHSDLA
ncbi:hypothetical protein PF010_g13038 [Phytophthora fragariae]|uniref:Uncharacterized protein n=1 Tax=Phytophthora fragariae TaxID=53985 RepID=A0A6A3Q246_9STRA|nr:hypothetical protein PF009_g10843 [Phytophthora fragariae]KAE9067284.1 hypothetical protein PF007_g28133 [Phytophthora fragariae]KAE9078246.1 hypothetical protein PF006_g27754 [Phytophthora fragariae]KAE9105407.1 hypothetical protein PF010_g13038 [Phytophthora fragariae]KAE9172839.1 hypothetical protein PF004_g27152 [Phytophthora fragariae]